MGGGDFLGRKSTWESGLEIPVFLSVSHTSQSISQYKRLTFRYSVQLQKWAFGDQREPQMSSITAVGSVIWLIPSQATSQSYLSYLKVFPRKLQTQATSSNLQDPVRVASVWKACHPSFPCSLLLPSFSRLTASRSTKI